MLLQALTSLSIIFFFSLFTHCLAYLLAEPISGQTQLLKPGKYFNRANTVPAVPVQTQSKTCRLDLSAELFGGVNNACGRNLDRSRCCPVLAAWLFAAHAPYAFQVPASAPSSAEQNLPMVPDDSQKCVNSLQSALLSKKVKIAQPNMSCDPILCFCGIRLHQITSLSCPAAFNVSSGFHNANPTAAVKNLEKNCKNSSYSGCTNCLGALQKLNASNKNRTKEDIPAGDERARKMFNRDCQLMGLTWLLARNKTAYIPTVSAVLRAIMYSAHHPPRMSTCSLDQENMPLAVDIEKSQSSSPSLSSSAFSFPVLMTMVSLLGL